MDLIPMSFKVVGQGLLTTFVSFLWENGLNEPSGLFLYFKNDICYISPITMHMDNLSNERLPAVIWSHNYRL